MLNDGYEIQLEDGSYRKALIVSTNYSIKYKCHYIVYTLIEEPDKNMIVPLKVVGEKIYIDYSYDLDFLQKVAESISTISLIKLPKKLDDFAKIAQKDKSKEKQSLKEDIVLPKNKVINSEEIGIKGNKKKVIFVRLNDKEHMLFKVINENDKEYICERINDKELNKNENDFIVLHTTFNTRNYYRLQGKSNITSVNRMNTKIAKELVVDDKEPINVLKVVYKDVYAYTIIKNNYEQDDKYVLEITTPDFIKHRKYNSIIVKKLETEDEYNSFLEQYRTAYYSNQVLEMNKTKKAINIGNYLLHEEEVKKAV